MSQAFIRKRRRRLGAGPPEIGGKSDDADVVVVVDRPGGAVVEEIRASGDDRDAREVPESMSTRRPQRGRIPGWNLMSERRADVDD
jgi:hypothetical protein